MAAGFTTPTTIPMEVLQVVHLMGAAMVGVSVVGVAWLSPRLRAAQNAAAA